MGTVRVLSTLVGDVRHDPATVTKYGHFFAALADRTPLVAVHDATLQGVDRWYNALRSFSPDRKLWQERFYKNPWAFRRRSHRVQDHLRSLQSQVDVILQMGVLFNAAGTIGAVRIPLVIYTDYTAALSARKPEAGRSPLAGRQLEQWLDLEQVTYRIAAHVCTRSKLVRRSLLDDYGLPGQRVSVIGGGVNFASLPSPSVQADDAPTILFIGKDYWRKGGDLLVDAFGSIRHACPRARLVLVTRDPWAPGSPPPGVTVVAPTWERERIAAHYRAADLFVLPSRLETWGDVLLEAMAYGLPVLGVDSDAMGEIVVDGVTGRLVPPGDVEALAGALRRLCQDPELRREWGTRGRRRVERHFQWFHVAERLLPVFDDVTRASIDSYKLHR